MEGTYAKELLCMEIHLHGEVLPEGGEEPKGILKIASAKMGYLMSLCWSGNQDDSVILVSHDVWEELATQSSSSLQAQLASGRPCLVGKMDAIKNQEYPDQRLHHTQKNNAGLKEPKTQSWSQHCEKPS